MVKNFANKTLLVTGGAGLVGAELTGILRTAGARVMRVDLAYPDGASEDDFVVDIASTQDLMPLIEQADGVFHLAGVSGVGDGEKSPHRCVENVAALSALCLGLSQLPAAPWLFFSSSIEVYQFEGDCPAPRNAYGLSKYTGELLLRYYADKSGLRAFIARFSTMYSGTQSGSKKVLPIFMSKALENEPIQINNSGDMFDFLHLDDVVAAILLAGNMLQEQTSGYHETVDICSGSPISLAALAQQVIDITGSNSEITLTETEAVPNVSNRTPDPGRTDLVLGWRLAVNLAEGLERVASEFRLAAAGEQVADCDDGNGPQNHRAPV